MQATGDGIAKIKQFGPGILEGLPQMGNPPEQEEEHCHRKNDSGFPPPNAPVGKRSPPNGLDQAKKRDEQKQPNGWNRQGIEMQGMCQVAMEEGAGRPGAATQRTRKPGQPMEDT